MEKHCRGALRPFSVTKGFHVMRCGMLTEAPAPMHAQRITSWRARRNEEMKTCLFNQSPFHGDLEVSPFSESSFSEGPYRPIGSYRIPFVNSPKCCTRKSHLSQRQRFQDFFDISADTAMAPPCASSVNQSTQLHSAPWFNVNINSSVHVPKQFRSQSQHLNQFVKV